MNSSWLGFMELFIVLAFVVGWGVLELVTLRMDKRRQRETERAEENIAIATTPPPVEPPTTTTH